MYVCQVVHIAKMDGRAVRWLGTVADTGVHVCQMMCVCMI